jgi:glycyl-tRNA synthetase beta chain
VPELLIEIGFEEMPAPWLPGLAEQLQARLVEGASREFLEAGRVAVAWTPRRLALRAELPPRQADREEPVWGPALKVARDAAGAWTQAAQGFAKKNGVAVTELQQAPKDPAKPGELNLLFVKKVAGRATSELVPGILAGVLRGLAFPKRMSWDAWLEDGKGAFPFGRPIRWLVLLFDGRVVPFQIFELSGGASGRVVVESGNATHGHRFLPKGAAKGGVAVGSFEELAQRLREKFVILDPGERASRIDEQLAAAAKGGARDDHGLRVEWRDLVEHPTVLVGQVPAEFRGLPTEVLETVLVHHQKYISLRDSGGRIDRFAAVTNGDGSSAAEIVRGMERVVVARLRDASFFLAEDRKRRLAERVPELAGVTFHKGLGSYQDKSARMVELVEEMGRQKLLSGATLAAATEAARLAKADLVTLMVREFPELQGVMGAVYLAGEGAAEDVASAVRHHYHPIAVEAGAEPAAAFAGRDAASRVFAAVALADKLDTLAGYFGIGESPTGSRDPFGLRRAGQGAVRAVLDFWRPKAGEPAPDLRALAQAAAAGYGRPAEPAGATAGQPAPQKGQQKAQPAWLTPAQTAEAVAAFLQDRLSYVLGARGFSADEVAAVVGAPQAPALSNLGDALERAQALQSVRRERPEDLAALAEAFKRAKNILAQAAPAAKVDVSLFEADAERALHGTASGLEQAKGSYADRLRGLAALREPIARFFDDVLVMAEDPRVRQNRLALLQQSLSLFYRIADISRLGGTS